MEVIIQWQRSVAVIFKVYIEGQAESETETEGELGLEGEVEREGKGKHNPEYIIFMDN